MIICNFKAGETLCGFPFQRAQYITALALAPGSEFLLSASQPPLFGENPKTLKLWKLPNGEFVEEFHFDQGVQVITCSSNGMVCVGLEGGRVCFLRINNLSSDSDNLKNFRVKN